MDLDKIFKFLAENLTDWSRVIILTLARPVSRFELSVAESGGASRIMGDCESERKLWLHPKLLAFAVLSIVLGLMINVLIPNHKKAPDLPACVVIILVGWFVSGSALHLACRCLAGKGRYLETLSVSLQVLATVYVVTSFISLIAASILALPMVAIYLKNIAPIGAVVELSVLAFFSLGTILLMVYISLALRSVHRFGWIRTMVIALVSLFTLFPSIMLYHGLGILTLGK